MKGMNIKDLEKEGYKEMEKIDLVNNKKEAMLVNILGIVIVVVMMAFIPLLIKASFVRSYRDNLLLSLIVFSVSLILWAPKTAGCGKRLVSTSAFHFGTMRFHARPTHIGSVLFRCFGQFFCRMNRSKRVLWRRVNGVYQQGIISNVNHIVPDAGRNQNGVIAARFLLIPQIVFAASHPDQRVAAFNSEKLIHTRMPLQPDIAARGNPHQGHLQVLPRPQRGAEIGILLRQPVYIDDERLPAVIAQSRICSSAISHLSCSLLSAQSLASYYDMAAAGKCC